MGQAKLRGSFEHRKEQAAALKTVTEAGEAPVTVNPRAGLSRMTQRGMIAVMAMQKAFASAEKLPVDPLFAKAEKIDDPEIAVSVPTDTEISEDLIRATLANGGVVPTDFQVGKEIFIPAEEGADRAAALQALEDEMRKKLDDAEDRFDQESTPEAEEKSTDPV